MVSMVLVALAWLAALNLHGMYGCRGRGAEGAVKKVQRAAGPGLVHGPEHWIRLRRLPRPGAGILVGEAQFFTDIMVRGRCLCMSGTAMIRTLYTRVKTAIRGGHY